MYGECKDCAFWHAGSGSFGECRFNPPVIVQLGSMGQTRYPATKDDYGCGQHEPKPKERKEREFEPGKLQKSIFGVLSLNPGRFFTARELAEAIAADEPTPDSVRVVLSRLTEAGVVNRHPFMAAWGYEVVEPEEQKEQQP